MYAPMVKVAVIGAGSFVFGPSVLRQATLEYGLDGLKLALVDVNADALAVMAELGRRMAREASLRIEVSSDLERMPALQGADFVICSAAPEMGRRHEIDYEIIQRHLPGHMITEFGGIAGISYSLRQMAFIRKLAADMERACPKAWLLDVANPLPRVCQAAHESGVRTAGFCSVSLAGYGLVARLLGGVDEGYPWPAIQQQMQATMAGLNHFCWVLGLKDSATGNDRLEDLRRALAAGRTTGNPVCEGMLRQTGYLLVPHDSHVDDFLPPNPRHVYRRPYHGGTAERKARWALLQQAARGEVPLDALEGPEAWEKPMAFVAAVAFGRPAKMHSLNLANEGQITNLPRGVFVETPCEVTLGGPQPVQVTLPDTVLPYCQATAEVTETIVRAGMEHRRSLVHRAVALDPTVVDKAAGIAAIDECLAAHADMVGEWVSG